MTLTHEAALTEEAIATRLAQLQAEVKQLNTDYELRPIKIWSRRWRKELLNSYSLWCKGKPGLKVFKLSDYGRANKDLKRRLAALDAVEAWIKERRESKPIEIDRSLYPTLPAVIPFSYDDIARRLGEIISADLKQGDIIQTPHSDSAPMTVVSHPTRRGDIVEFEAVREGEEQFACAFHWRWRFKLVGRHSKAA